MSMFDNFAELDSVNQLVDDDISTEAHYTDNISMSPMWEHEYDMVRTTPVLYNLDGFISPYACDNWGCPPSTLATVRDDLNMTIAEKVDPNRIYTADIAALRTLASDQLKITKAFEKKLAESLRSKDKMGLDEMDIMAMQAVTSARSTIASINKEQINIKKNIADIKIKQATNKMAAANGGPASSDSSANLSSSAIGRGILDDIFRTPSMPMAPINTDYQAVSADNAGNMLDNIMPSSTLQNNIKYENENPTTYVIVGDNDDDYEFQTYNSEDILIEGYPNPNSTITTVDREAGFAVDEYLVQYPIKRK